MPEAESNIPGQKDTFLNRSDRWLTRINSTDSIPAPDSPPKTRSTDRG
jgi:hypothetical protein